MTEPNTTHADVCRLTDEAANLYQFLTTVWNPAEPATAIQRAKATHSVLLEIIERLHAAADLAPDNFDVLMMFETASNHLMAAREDLEIAQMLAIAEREAVDAVKH